MNKISRVRQFIELSERLTGIIPDWITGSSDVMQQKFYKKYGTRDYSQLIRKTKAYTMSSYLLIAGIFLFLIFWSMIAKPAGSGEITSISRPGSGQGIKSVPVRVCMQYGNVTLKKDVTLTIGQKELTQEEKLAKLREFRKSLGRMILGENKNLEHISKPLNLIERDPETGITIDWTSSDPTLVSESGEVDLVRAGETKNVELKADLMMDDAALTAVYKLKIDQEASGEDYERSLALTLEHGLDGLAEDRFSEKVLLPGQMENGIKVRWLSGQQGIGVILLPTFLLMMLFVYFKRYDRINREIREAETSVGRDLPEFINKLVLLLNAGLVFSTAFTKIMEDYESFCGKGKSGQNRKKFLYEEMLEIQKKVDQSNASLIRELKEFSQRCGVREMVRLTAVISDNWNKGSTLSEKLEAESNLLWISRKKSAEEKGKLAETKLTFPLMILLLVLIMVTIAPAMLEM